MEHLHNLPNISDACARCHCNSCARILHSQLQYTTLDCLILFDSCLHHTAQSFEHNRLSNTDDDVWPGSGAHRAGSQLEAGDLRGVSSTLSSNWVDDFQRATDALDTSDAEKAQASAIFEKITGLKASVSSGDLKGSKRQYVTLVAAVEDWAKSTGLSANLKGL